MAGRLRYAEGSCIDPLVFREMRMCDGRAFEIECVLCVWSCLMGYGVERKKRVEQRLGRRGAINAHHPIPFHCMAT
jgi:hypothetical protein